MIALREEQAAPRSLLLVAALQFAVPMLTAGAFFVFRGQATDLNDPNLPFAFRLLKDAAFALAVFAPLGVMVLTRAVRVPLPMALLWMAPPALALLMLAIGTLKTGSTFASIGLLRNIGIFYVASGAIALLAWWWGYTRWLFVVFRALMAFSVILGLSFYVLADDILHYTIHGRMIGTLANPNFLGFLCVLWLAVLHAEAARLGRLTLRIVAELALATIGLIGAASLAALLCYVAWMSVVLVLRVFRVIPASRGLGRAFIAEIVMGGLAALVGLTFFLTNDAAQLLIRVGLVASGGSETTSIRFIDLATTYGGLIAIEGILLGQTASAQYIQFDGTNQTYLYNFGVPFFLLWAAFILSPVVLSARHWRRWAAERTDDDWLAMMLVPFVAVSFFVQFWIQYVPEMYPTCVLFGFVMYFLILHASPRESRRIAAIYVR